VLGPRHADGHRQAQLGAHASPNRPRNLCRRSEEMRAPCHVGEGLVDGDLLCQGGVGVGRITGVP
jgi:hypothetical protein